MARRAKRKTKRTHSRKKRKAAGSKKSLAVNKKAHWAAYKELQKRVDKAWSKLKSAVKKKANAKVLIREKNHLLLLLGECNFMARECMRCGKKRR
jgi:hypothetical protein